MSENREALTQRWNAPATTDGLQFFDKWVIDFVGPINPPGKKMGARYIITATDYVTRWAEAKPVKYFTDDTIAQFIF